MLNPNYLTSYNLVLKINYPYFNSSKNYYFSTI